MQTYAIEPSCLCGDICLHWGHVQSCTHCTTSLHIIGAALVQLLLWLQELIETLCSRLQGNVMNDDSKIGWSAAN